MPAEDLVRYRDSGELSDLTVKIGDTAEMRLHRFPLFIKSDYFKELLAEQTGELAKATAELPADFPGGPECFGLIADFCYNKRIDISPENVVQLRCAAERLKMSGQGNLIDLSDRYLTDLLAAAKLARSAGPLVDLLAQCTAVGAAADEAARVSERCLAALLDVWTRTSAFATLAHHHHHHQQHLFNSSTDSVTEQLLTLPLARFLQLIRAVCAPQEAHEAESTGSLSAAVNERLRRRPLAELTARYLDRVFRRDQVQTERSSGAAAAPPTPPERETEASVAAEADAGQPSQDGDEGQAEEAESGPPQQQTEQPASTKKAPVEFEPKEPTSVVLDRVVLSLPEDTPLAEVIGADWIRRALRASESASPECRTKLLQLAGNILHRFDHDELREMPPPVLCEIVDSTVKNDGVVPEVLSCVVDNHLLDLARAGSLSVTDFVKLAASMPPDYRTSHDTLFEVAETLLTADTPLSETDQQQVHTALDLTRCSEATLQRALDRELVPAKLVGQAAISVAKKLREQLEEQEKRETYRGAARGIAPAGSSRRFDTANIRYHDPLSGVHQHHYYHHEGYSPTASAAASGPTYSQPHASSRSDDDQSLAIFEENLRVELGKISASYDHYLADKGARSEYRFSYRGSAGKRW